MRRGILIISASMGAGHDGAARELRSRLEARGHDVRIVDFLDLVPFRLGGSLRWAYQFQLRRIPWSYDLTYQAFNRGLGALLWGPVVRALSLCMRRAFRRELERSRPDAVVSTYPLASLVLGRLRKQRRLQVPVATYLTDFAVHPLWVHPGIDLHLAVSPTSAAEAERRGGLASRAPGPLVGSRFRDQRPDRDEMRRILGVEPGERAVLIVGGSWGIGDVASTVASVTRCGPEYHPITVCGSDERLRSSLIEQGLGGTVLGWTDEMPGLMAAADALVENAGGLSAMEAFAAGLPVISFQPIAGHGKDNAQRMATSGVSRYAHDERELAVALEAATNPGPVRDAMIASGHELFASDPADHVVELATGTSAHALLTPVRRRRGGRGVGYAAVSVLGVYFLMTTGAHGVAAMGVGVAKPPRGAEQTIYLAVRVASDELRHAGFLEEIQRLDVTAVVDARTAKRTSDELHLLSDAGVDIANGGWGEGRFLRWNRAHDDCKKSWRTIANHSGTKAREFVPGRALDAFDEIYCRTGREKQHLIRPNKTFTPDAVPTVEDRKVYLLDGRDSSAGSVLAALDRIERQARAAGFDIRPFEDLR